MVFCHAMDADKLKAHLKRLIIPGDCSLCEWFGDVQWNNNQGSEA